MKPPKTLEHRHFLTLLERTPTMMLEHSDGLSDAELQASWSRDSWSMLDVLWHLRGCDAVWVESINAMLLEDTPSIAYQHPNDWWKTHLVKAVLFHDLLKAFSIKRQGLLEQLRGLTSEDWLRTGVIKARQHSVYSQVRRLTLHEAHHEQQFSKLRAWLLESQHAKD
jgi:hypothetical protein